MSVHPPPPLPLPSSSAPMPGTIIAPASIQALPAELIEHILILAALSGFPNTIAALARTCSAFAALIYHSPDQHLWREVFLATFDDPRRFSLSQHFDWGAQYRARVWAAALFKRSSSSPCSSHTSLSEGEDDGEEVKQYTRALETLADVAHTALPYPPTICAVPAPDPACAAANTVPGSVPQPGFPSYPIFPPPPNSCLCPLPFPCINEGSRNIQWLEKVFAGGLPPPLARRMSGRNWEGGILGDDLDEQESRLMQALGKVVAFTGFRPARGGTGSSGASARSGSSVGSLRFSGSDAIMSADEEDSASGESSGSESGDVCTDEPVKDTGEDVEETTDLPSTTPARLASETFIAGASVVAGLSLDTSATAQARRARRLARMRAYNLRFLDPARGFGPFLRADPPAGPAVAAADSTTEEAKGKGKAREGLCGRAADLGESDDEESDWEPLPPPTLRKEAEKATWTHTRLPPPGELSPDWTFLAAARVVVEANLREAVGAAQLVGLTALDGLRAGSAPLEIGACAVRCDEQAGRSADKGREGAAMLKDLSGSVPGQVQSEGWDWAGVTGVWRRCICWLDYRDLISHNLSSDFNDPELTEAVRVVPMRLRVSGFAPPANPRFPDRPTLLVSGETAVNAVTGVARRLEGSVAVVKDGSIHWRIVLMGQNPGDPTEWASEGIQVGGPGSAMGVLGFWTGSLHEKMDPLGPCWAWKVG